MVAKGAGGAQAQSPEVESVLAAGGRGEMVSWYRSPRPGYVLFLLTSAYLFSFFDRQIIVLMIGPLKRDMGISDSQFALLYGFAFSLFYTFLGLTFGRLIDAYSRTTLLSLAIILWSAATAVCGLADNFTELFLARMMVGVGEAALAPAAYSMLADLFKQQRQARAFSIYATGIYLGTGGALLFGGQVVEALQHLPPFEIPILGMIRGWQMAFLIAGIPGIFLGLIFILLREPERGRLEAVQPNSEEPAIGVTRAYIANFKSKWRAYSAHHLAYAMHTGLGFAIITWMPTHYIRAHGWEVGRTGWVFGLLILIVGPICTVTGGLIVERMIGRGRRDGYFRWSAYTCAIMGLSVAFGILSPNPWIGLLGVAGAVAGVAFTPGSAGAALQVITPSACRGQAGAFYTFVVHMAGVSLIPLFVALLTDHYFEDPVRAGTSLMIVAFATMAPAALLFWVSRNYFLVPVESARQDSPSPH